MPFLNEADNITLGDVQVNGIYIGDVRAWPPAQGSQPQISGVSSAGSLNISWAPTEFAELYELRRNGTTIATIAGTVYSDTGLAWDGQYSYTVIPIAFGVPGTESIPSTTATIPKGTVGNLSASSRSYTNVTVSWAAVAGADQYRVYRSGSLYATVTGLTKAVATTANTNKDIYVQPVRSGVVGNKSPTYRYFSGRAKQTDSGSKGFWVRCIKTGAWRSMDGWINLSSGRIGQGTYRAEYGNYRGIIDFGASGFRNQVRSATGNTNREVYGWSTSGEVWLYRRPAGPNGPGAGHKGIRLYTSDSAAYSGRYDPAPSVDNNTYKHHADPGYDVWKSYSLTTAILNRLGHGSSRSLAMIFDSYTIYSYGGDTYAVFNGKDAGANDCDVYINWSWSYTTVTALSNTWTKL